MVRGSALRLGSEFESEVIAAIEAATEQPLRLPRMLREVRCVRVRRFPYSVFFLSEATRIVVLSVFHARRSPSIWQARIKQLVATAVRDKVLTSMRRRAAAEVGR
jgi:hypothetical protein